MRTFVFDVIKDTATNTSFYSMFNGPKRNPQLFLTDKDGNRFLVDTKYRFYENRVEFKLPAEYANEDVLPANAEFWLNNRQVGEGFAKLIETAQLVKVENMGDVPSGGGSGTRDRVAVTNLPSSYPLPTAQVNALRDVVATLSSNVVRLDANTLTALENIIVSGQVSLTPDTISALTSALAVSSMVHVVNEVPTGLVNGTNKVFTTYYNFKPLSTRIFVNGLRQSDPINYLETSNNQVTLSFAPAPNDVLLIDYIKS